MNLSNEERVVLDLIRGANPRITQLEIYKHEKWLGCHPIHEAHLNIDHRESTLRKIRQIIRNLRIKHGQVILSDKDGYWMVRTSAEAVEYLKRIENMAKAQARAWYETYAAMKKNYHIESKYFEKNQLQSFFDEYQEEQPDQIKPKFTQIEMPLK